MSTVQAVLIVALFGFAACGRLDSQYLPPNQAANQYQGGAPGGYSGGAGAPNAYSGGGGGGGQFQKNANNDIPILRLDSQNEGDGNYQYAFETGNGIQAQQQGNAQDGSQIQGSYSYTSPEGEQIQISYQADGNGYQPQGSHIPTPPPIPQEIQKAIEQNLADEARGVVDDGQYKPEYDGGAGSGGQGGAGGYRQQGGYQQGGNGYQGANSNQYIPPSSGQRQGGYKY
ncbi:pupal cuticle protein 20 [Sitophilus oryzae]|uniref:Pupal cuticle protein 20 n=1 Tax=Sitophilus oryzae TaxID=7048 RepID=A0A6J2XL85_SITOR|nr:pupal cuticle protein 20 [Sitophilus oryzae]